MSQNTIPGKIESEHEDAQIFPNRLLPKPSRKAPPTQRPITLISREQRESRDASSSEISRDLTGVVATAMTEFDSTPPSMVSMRISPQIAEASQSRSDEAMSQSGINHGHGIPRRQKTESSLSYIAPHPSPLLHEAFCNEVNKVEDHPDLFPRVQGETLTIDHTDADGERLQLRINFHPADNFYFGIVDAMRTCKGEPKIPFTKKACGPSVHGE